MSCVVLYITLEEFDVFVLCLARILLSANISRQTISQYKELYKGKAISTRYFDYSYADPVDIRTRLCLQEISRMVIEMTWKRRGQHYWHDFDMDLI